MKKKILDFFKEIFKGIFLLVILFLGAVFIYFMLKIKFEEVISQDPAFVIALTFLATFIISSIYYNINSKTYEDLVSQHLEEQYKTKSDENEKDIILQILKNHKEITEYYQISKVHSKISFLISIIACISGIIILGVTVYTVIILKQTDIAVVGVISGAITELIAGTIFWLHNKSALQLNHYYDALHENEKVLLAINLTNTLSPEERESMCKEIIRTQIYKQKIDK